MGNVPVTSKALDYCHSERHGITALSALMQGYRTSMEDSYCIHVGKNICIFGIFDGHGGPETSTYLAQNLPGVIEQLQDPFDEKQLTEACLQLDEQVKSVDSQRDGSTCIFLITQKEADGGWKIATVNIGDSRALLLDVDSSNFKTLSEDHKPDQEDEYNRINAAGSYVNEGRIDNSLNVSRAMGDRYLKKNRKDPKAGPETYIVTAVPDVTIGRVKPGQRVLVFSDGLVSRHTNMQIAQFHHKHRHQELTQLLPKLLDWTLFNMSTDNMSVILVEFQETQGEERKTHFIPQANTSC